MPVILGYGWLVVTGVGAPALAWILLFRRRRARSPTITKIRGPSAPSWIFGNMKQLLLPTQYGDHEFDWQKSYGAVYRIKGCFGEDRLMLSDPGALQSIIASSKFEHTPVFHNLVKLLSDEGSLSVVKGEQHRRLRAGLNPSFSSAAVRRYEPTMQQVAQAITNSLNATLDSGREIDMYPLLATATLTSISQAVLGCTTLDTKLIKEFVRNNTRASALTAGLTPPSILADSIGARVPEWIWDLATLLPVEAFNVLRRVRQLARRIGRRVVQEKQNATREGLEGGNDVFAQLLSSERSDKTTRASLTEEDVVAQTSLFLIAGQEPAAHTLAFGLLELARNPEFQDRLRREVQLSSGLAYADRPVLDAFIKEILRLYPISPLMERVAVEDTIIPLAECITSATGERISQIPIRRGQIVNLAIASYQRLESLWGPDAHEFKPSRWLGGAAYQGGGTVGPYANLLAFFGGARTCLGWRFATLEMQIFFSELVANFSFTIPESGESAGWRVRGSTILRPVTSTGEKGAVLCVTRVS